MYIKIINPATNGKNAYSNRGSARQATNYLEGEAKKLGDKATFFTGERTDLSGDEAVQLIDSNRKGLRKEDAKFYSLVISPSELELDQIGNDPDKMRAYTVRVMQEYAANFKTKQGNTLGEKDLVWAATQHNERHHRGYDGLPSSQLKEGLQTHIHVMVSARDRSQKVTLNPLSNRARFNRVDFMAKGIAAFEEEFGQAKSTNRTRPTEPSKDSSRGRRTSRTAEEIAASIRRRAAENTGKGWSNKEEQNAHKGRETVAQVRDRRLFDTVSKLNEGLPAEQHLRHNKVLQAAREQDYSKQFYGRLGQLGRDIAAGKQVYHPYEFLRTGKALDGTDFNRAQEKQEKRLFEQVNRINMKLPSDKQLEHNTVLQIAREQEFSKAFYGRIGRIGREANSHKYKADPYDFLRTGRVYDPSKRIDEQLQEALPGKLSSSRRQQLPTVPSLARPTRVGARVVQSHRASTTQKAAGIGQDLGRALGTEGYTQDIRGDEERD